MVVCLREEAARTDIVPHPSVRTGGLELCGRNSGACVVRTVARHYNQHVFVIESLFCTLNTV